MLCSMVLVLNAPTTPGGMTWPGANGPMKNGAQTRHPSVPKRPDEGDGMLTCEERNLWMLLDELPG